MVIIVNVDSLDFDWIRIVWTWPPYKSKMFMEKLRADDMTLRDFKETALYQHALKVGWIKDDQWTEKGTKMLLNSSLTPNKRNV